MSGTQLQSIPTDTAKFPVNYETAKLALYECHEIDECKDWADKAEAIASYAKQIKDETLLDTAKRIKGRAIRRCGELIREIEAANGARTDLEPMEGTLPRLTRTETARESGLSEHQQKTAARVANIPEEEFEELIEQPSPPTVTDLAKRGTKPKPKPKPLVDFYAEGISEYEFKQAIRLHGFLDDLLREVITLDVDAGIKGTMQKLKPGLLQDAAKAKQIMNSIWEKLNV